MEAFNNEGKTNKNKGYECVMGAMKFNGDVHLTNVLLKKCDIKGWHECRDTYLGEWGAAWGEGAPSWRRGAAGERLTRSVKVTRAWGAGRWSDQKGKDLKQNFAELSVFVILAFKQTLWLINSIVKAYFKPLENI